MPGTWGIGWYALMRASEILKMRRRKKRKKRGRKRRKREKESFHRNPAGKKEESEQTRCDLGNEGSITFGDLQVCPSSGWVCT